MRREQAEEQLIVDRERFEAKLARIITNLDVYKTKDSPFLNAEEMRTNSEALKRLNDEIQGCVLEAEVISFHCTLFYLKTVLPNM